MKTPTTYNKPPTARNCAILRYSALSCTVQFPVLSCAGRATAPSDPFDEHLRCTRRRRSSRGSGGA
eukprot:15453320-Alexandrium_andersonii.AAC.1